MGYSEDSSVAVYEVYSSDPETDSPLAQVTCFKRRLLLVLYNPRYRSFLAKTFLAFVWL